MIQRCRSMALLRTLSLQYVDRLPTFVFSPRGRFASRRAAALPDDQVPDQGQGQSEDLAAARRWLAKLDPQTVPRHLCEIAFSRSGGPGGQNVNKCVSSLGLRFAILAIFARRLTIENRVNSKATLKIPLDALLPFVPRLVHPPLLSSRYVAQRSNTLVIQSEESRKQASNVESCFEKLYQLLRSSAEEVIPGETSQDQKERVHRLYVYIFPLCVSYHSLWTWLNKLTWFPSLQKKGRK